MRRYTYKPGEWNVLCQVCGRRFPASKILTRWDGVLVCKDDYETRHPQDLLRVPQEDTSVPFTNPEVYEFITGVCNELTSHPYAGMGTADCARAGWSTLSYEQLLAKYCSEGNKTGISGIAIAGCALPHYNSDAYI